MVILRYRYDVEKAIEFDMNRVRRFALQSFQFSAVSFIRIKVDEWFLNVHVCFGYFFTKLILKRRNLGTDQVMTESLEDRRQNMKSEFWSL